MPKPEPETDNPLAFAYLVAGLFMQRNGQVGTAAALYAAALRLDAGYGKAANNRGLLILDEGARTYVEAVEAARNADRPRLDPEAAAKVERLWRDAGAMFRAATFGAITGETDYVRPILNRATVQGPRDRLVAEYPFNLASVRSYRGRLAARQGDPAMTSPGPGSGGRGRRRRSGRRCRAHEAERASLSHGTVVTLERRGRLVNECRLVPGSRVSSDRTL